MHRIKIYPKFILLMGLMLTGMHLLSQVKKGSWLIEGDIGNIRTLSADTKYESPSSASTSEGRDFSISIFPRAGYFVSNVLVIGAELDLAYSNTKYKGYDDQKRKTSDSKYNSGNLGFAPFIRYYFCNSRNFKSKFYIQAGAGFNMSIWKKNDYTYYNVQTGAVSSTGKYNFLKNYLNFTGNASAGFNQMLSSTVALNLNLGYRMYRFKETSNYETTIPGNPATTSDASTYTYNGKHFTWGFGFSLFLPSKKNKS